jgi:hypothetical protein
MKTFKLIPWNGVPVNEGTKQEWINEMIKDLAATFPGKYEMTYTMSGDTMIVVEKFADDTFYITECLIRRAGSYNPDLD